MPSDELKAVALELFKVRRNGGVSAAQVALSCFRDAQSFLDVADQIEMGDLELGADKNPLDDGYAPNLSKTHPINLMSKEWGDIQKVRDALKIVESPTVNSLDQYHWGKNECNLARTLFPGFLRRAEELAAN